MRVMLLFCDMLGAEFLSLFNSQRKETKIDELLSEYGGIVYKNCYTPAPDTPRSSACTWSGVYPRRNGCDNRLKYPGYFLNDDIDDLWRMINRYQCTTNIFVDDSNNRGGLIRFTGSENIKNGSVYDFCEEIKKRKNEESFNFIYLPDMHTVLDETDYSREGFYDGCDFLAELIDRIFGIFESPDFFDYILIFSDHGFSFLDDKRRCHMIDRDRVHTVMYLRKKGDKVLHIDTELRSNMDRYPTICDIYSCAYEGLDGKSLFDNGHDYVLIEDHDKFSIEFGLTAEHWAVVDKDQGLHWLECSGQWEHEHDGDTFDELAFEKVISERMSDYGENKRLFDNYFILYEPNDNRKTKETMYSDGTHFHDSRYYFQSEDAVIGKRIILYGAGRVGKDYYRQLVKVDCEIVCVVDVNWEKCADFPQEVQGIGSLFKYPFDYVIVCLFEENQAQQVKNMVVQLEIDPEKVLWDKPIRKRCNPFKYF